MRFTGRVKTLLVSIQETIDRRVEATLTGHPEWPCRAGCDHCCRHLAAVPEITQAEWTMLSQGINNLAADVRFHVTERIRALGAASYPFTCPMLDTGSGRCLTYAYRPLACRTYGFYVERDKGLYCDRIRAVSAAGELDGIVWGSQAAIEERSAGLGPKRSVLEWFKADSDGD